MIKHCISLLFAVMLLLPSCEKIERPDDISTEIYNLVHKLDPSSVDEYLYNSETVYHFDTWRGPDDLTYLYSSSGVQMAAFGGFTGKGDGRCTDFYEKAKYIRTVYSDGHWIKSK